MAPTSLESIAQPGIKSGKPSKAKRTRGRPHLEFAVFAPVGSEVHLAGTFNDWDSTSLPLHDKHGNGDFRVIVPLAPGVYHYKFVINGVWQADISCPRWSLNEHGSLNSILEVKGGGRT